jgi:hypothetical protein
VTRAEGQKTAIEAGTLHVEIAVTRPMGQGAHTEAAAAGMPGRFMGSHLWMAYAPGGRPRQLAAHLAGLATSTENPSAPSSFPSKLTVSEQPAARFSQPIR